MGVEYHRRWAVPTALLAALFATAGCGDDGTGPDDLGDARGRWESFGIVDYSYEVRRICFCGNVNPVRVTVRAGERISAFDLERELELVGDEATLYPTIDGLFDVLDDAYERDAFRVEVEYDLEMGYPTSIFIDYLENAVDEELGFDVVGPVVIEGG